ncbi:glycosyltransferase [Devosia sp.]|uniref:glycosyltransferase family 2 protein n=1 Tax=Devosia sp. TaxID=1871048 RepID=UPI0025C463A1|nr:glycosyltransferase [Devosia sp.]
MTIASTGQRGLPSVFVVVPCYNYGRFLEACVRSVLSQEGVEPRVLVIDDASKDNTADIGERLAREDHRVQFIRHVKNAGHIATFNQGIDQATGDYFLLLSADDYLLPGALGRAAAVMEKHPEVGFTFGPARVEGQAAAGALAPPAEGYLGAARVLSGLEFVRLSGPRNIVLTPTVVIRRALQQKVGGYLGTLPHSGDMEMWLRLAGEGSVGYIDVDQAVYRRHENNMSIAYDGMADLLAREKAFRAFFVEAAPKLDPSRRIEQECLHGLAAEAFRHASMALNRRDPVAAAQFKRYGLSLSPTARFSLNWLKLGIKQALWAPMLRRSGA